MFLVLHVSATQGRLYKEHKSKHDTHDQESSTPNGAYSGQNSKDRKSKHPVTPQLMIITIYHKITVDKVRSYMDFLIMCCVKMAVFG